MKKLILTIIIILIQLNTASSFSKNTEAIEFTQQEKDWIKDHPVILVAPDPVFPPYEFYDSNEGFSGISMDYLKEVSDLTGLEFKILRFSTWSEVLAKAQSKEIDMLSAATKTPQRSEYLIFTEPYIITPNVIVMRNDVENTFELDEMSEMNVSVPKDYAIQEFIETNYPSIHLDKVETIGVGLRKVSFHMVDAMAADLGQVSYTLQESGITNLKVVGEAGYNIELAFAIRDDWPELRSILDKTLASISKETKDSIYTDWIHLQTVSSETFARLIQVFAIIMSVIFFIILWFIFWNRRLKHTVNVQTGELQNELAERVVVEKKLALLNSTLENKVKERTQELIDVNEELEQSLDNLTKTQTQLIESEKLAALGRLVAGVAHEINTPIGSCITVTSYMEKENRETLSLFQDNNLTRSSLNKYLEVNSESLHLVLGNLDQAAALVSRFKQIATDQSKEELRSFKIKDYFATIIDGLKYTVKSSNISITLICPDNLKITSYPGHLAQIVTNLVLNSALHGFNEDDYGVITITICEKADEIELSFEDNGNGMEKEVLNKVFDPFFTTSRGKGSAGLGLNIIYNLVTITLNGTIKITSEKNEGTTVLITIPKKLAKHNNTQEKSSE